MLLCAISDRQRLPPAAEADRRGQLRTLLRDWIEGGVDVVQIREKDLSSADLFSFSAEVLAGLSRAKTKILINLPAPSMTGAEHKLAALCSLCDGIHLPGKPSAEDAQLVRQAFRQHGRECLVSMSCHGVQDIHEAHRSRADMVLFAPVFEKKVARDGEQFPNMAQGLAALRHACEAAEAMPVFALGGVTAVNAADCRDAGAAGVAGIRLFQEGGWRSLRPSGSIYS